MKLNKANIGIDDQYRRKRMTGKNRARKILAMTAVVTMLGAGAVPVSAASGAQKGVEKDETVYVVTEADGSQTDITVSDELHNSQKLDRIHDVSNLQDIENVKGDETFKQGKKGALTWNAGGKDIFYQGTTEEEAPVQLGISYFLDGDEVSGADMKGASGKVKIVIHYRNRATDEKGNMVPFLAITGFIAEDDHFTDIKIDHGKVIDDGEKKIIAALAAPGLSEALDLDPDLMKLDLEDTVTITGTARDFDVQDMMTLVTNSVFDEIDTEDFANLDYDSQIRQLDQGASALVDGSRQLYRGMDSLYGNMPKLKKGVDQLTDGSSQIKEGTDSARKGSEDLASGIDQLAQGLSPLSSQIDSAAEATARMQTGSGQILEGMRQLQTGLDGDGTEQNPGAVKALDQVSEGLGQISSGLSGSKDQLKQLEQLKELQTYAKAVSDYVNAVNSTINKPGVKSVLEKAGYSEMIRKTGQAGKAADAVSSALGKVDVSGAVTGLDQAVTGIDSANGAVKQVSAGLGQASGNMPAMIEGMSQIDEGLGQMNENFQKVSGKTEQLNSGIEALTRGSSDLVSGEVQLAGGAKDLARGMTSLQDKSRILGSGVSRLDQGSLELSKGMSKLYRQGIRRIVDLYRNDLKGSLDSLEDTFQAGQSYETFTRLDDGMKGSVKFIYKTSLY